MPAQCEFRVGREAQLQPENIWPLNSGPEQKGQSLMCHISETAE